MMDSMMMSLDEIIKSNRIRQKPKEKRNAPKGNRRAGGKRLIGKTSPVNGSGRVRKFRKRTGAAQKIKFSRGNGISGEKRPTSLMVCNLDYGVNDADIMELFNENGTMKKGAVHYDSFGNSLGTAELVFQNSDDAMRILKKFHGVRLDGRRLKIHLVLTTPDVKPQPFKYRPFKRSFKRASLKSRNINRSVGDFDSMPWDSSFGSNSNYMQEPDKDVIMGSWLPNWTRF